MALLEDLIDGISDPQLRQRIAKQVTSLTRQNKFGLVSERHEPELVTVRASVRAGSRVTHRKRPDDHTQYTSLKP